MSRLTEFLDRQDAAERGPIPDSRWGDPVADVCARFLNSMSGLSNMELLTEMEHANQQGCHGDSLALLIEYATRRATDQYRVHADRWLPHRTTPQRGAILARALEDALGPARVAPESLPGGGGPVEPRGDGARPDNPGGQAEARDAGPVQSALQRRLAGLAGPVAVPAAQRST